MRARLIIDGQTRLDDDLDTWHKRPPELLADMIKPGAKVETYLKAAAMELADCTIQYTAGKLVASGWSLTCETTADSVDITVKTWRPAIAIGGSYG